MSKKYERTWGWFYNLDEDDHSSYKIKKICIYPGKRVALQSHNERTEHWVFVKGESKVYLNNNLLLCITFKTIGLLRTGLWLCCFLLLP
jgi:mannose-6-phosphate isomerase-like protein (cupin superfamily)